MKYIAHLDLVVNHSIQGERWRTLATEIGAPFREYDGPVGNIDGIESFIRNATGLVLPSENFLLTPQLFKAITERVDDGVPLLLWVDPNSLEQLNVFLRRYGLEGTRFAVHDDAGISHSRITELNREQSHSAFYPHPLLEGVDNLVIQQPNVIYYGGRAIPIITLPLRRFRVVDMRTDFSANWTSPELSCLVLSPIVDNGGVLAISCGFTHDPYLGPTGVEFPGISAADNEVLALNILKWLTGSRLHSETTAANAFTLVDSIERSLVEFAVERLKGALNDWWTDGIPLPVRNKCAQRREEEGNKIPKWAYLDLLDVRTIFEKNWKVFERDLAAVGWSGGKGAALSWFVELNEIRRNVMHPIRRHFVSSLVDHSTISKLKTLLDRVSLLGVRNGHVDSCAG